MRTFEQILDALISSHTRDWTPTERASLRGLRASIHDLFWRATKEEDVDALRAALKVALQGVEPGKRVAAARIANLAMLQHGFEVYRRLDVEQESAENLRGAPGGGSP